MKLTTQWPTAVIVNKPLDIIPNLNHFQREIFRGPIHSMGRLGTLCKPQIVFGVASKKCFKSMNSEVSALQREVWAPSRFFFKILKSFQDYSVFQLNFEHTIVLIGFLYSEKHKFSFLNMMFLTLTLPPSLLGHQTKYLQFMGTFRITKIALFSTMRPFYSYIWIGNLQSDHKRS